MKVSELDFNLRVREWFCSKIKNSDLPFSPRYCKSTSICQKLYLPEYNDHHDVSEHPYLSRILGPGHGMFGALVIRSSPVEMKLLEPVDPRDGPVSQSCRINTHQPSVHPSCWTWEELQSAMMRPRYKMIHGQFLNILLEGNVLFFSRLTRWIRCE